MFLTTGLVLVLCLTGCITNGQETTYQILNMTDAKTFDEIPCSQSCGGPLDIGLGLISGLFKTFLKEVPFGTEYCRCNLLDLGGFTFTHTCFTNQETTAFDHILALTFPDFNVRCECDFSNSPSKAAEIVNKGTAVDGQCGKQNYANKHHCEPMKCEGSEGGDGDSKVDLAIDLKGSTITFKLRVDTEENPVTKQNDVFPLELALITLKPIDIIFKADSGFEESQKCLKKNQDNLFCHLAENGPSPFFECLTPNADANVVDRILYLFGKC